MRNAKHPNTTMTNNKNTKEEPEEGFAEEGGLAEEGGEEEGVAKV
jgi:hypothetical protein